jgi:hypothetical protein
MRMFAPALFVFFALSCASLPTPETYYADRSDPFSLTESGAELYLAARLPASRSIVEGLAFGTASVSQLGDFLDRGDLIVAALYPEHADRRFIGAASGSFPGARGGLYLRGSKDWKKAVSAAGIEYWRSDAANLSLHLSARRLFFSDGDPFVKAPGARSPAALAKLAEGAALYGWLENSSGPLEKIILSLGVELGIPSEKLLFAVYETGTAYTAVLRLETPGNSQALALTRIFGLASLGMAGTDFSQYREFESVVKALFGGSCGQDGAAVIIKTGALSGGELALLFNTLSLY